MKEMYERFMRNRFLFEELVKRDFKKKYKRTALGMLWSILSPLMSLLVLYIVFGHFFGSRIEHYVTYLFCGNVLYSYYRESTSGGMNALVANSSIFSKINVPKYMFLLSKNISALINFGLTLIILFVFVLLDNLSFHLNYITLLYPIILLVVFNIGIGLILSAICVFFRDVNYLYDVFTMMLMYMSAIFYSIDIVPEAIRGFFYLNPVYCFIEYFRTVIMYDCVPDSVLHGLCFIYTFVALGLGAYVYKKYNYKFLYYI